MDLQKEREDFEKFKAKQIGIDYETLKNDLDDCERRFPNNRYAGWNFKSDWELWQEAKSQAVPEWAVIVPRLSANYLFNKVPELGFKHQVGEYILHNNMEFAFTSGGKKYVLKVEEVA